MKAVIYARTATKDRVESERSIKAQTDSAREYAQANGFDIAGFFTDEGCSGTRLDRSGLSKLRRMIAHNSIDIVIVRDHSRLSRSMADASTLAEEFARRGTRICCTWRAR